MRDEGPDSVRSALATVAVAHLGLLGFMLGARVFLVGGQEGWRALFDGMAAWDAQHYLTVAREGYVAEHLIVRLPLLPLLIRGTSFVLRDVLLSGYVVAFAAHVAAGAHLYALLRLDEPEEVARRAFFAWLVFPAAFVAVVPLSEGLFFLGVCGAFYWWRRGRLGIAAVMALVAATTRVTGVLLVPALFAEALARREARPRWSAVALALALPGAGFAAYLWLNQAVEGHALHFLAVQKADFLRTGGSPLAGLREAWGALDRPRPENFTLGVFEIAGTVLAWAATAYAVWRRRAGDAVYAGLSAAAFTFQTFWISNLRYAYVLHPLFPLLARAAGRPVARVALFALSLGALALLAMQFARGHWAA